MLMLRSDSIRSGPKALIKTPCEKICVLDPPSGLCRGCGRTLAEIERWTAYSDGERARVMAELPSRLTAIKARAGATARL
jgi:predicted Fe-S protein YdhL (DUF1289 family)